MRFEKDDKIPRYLQQKQTEVKVDKFTEQKYVFQFNTFIYNKTKAPCYCFEGCIPTVLYTL